MLTQMLLGLGAFLSLLITYHIGKIVGAVEMSRAVLAEIEKKEIK